MNALNVNIRRKVFARDGTDIEVVRGLELALRAGEFVAVLGPSGCGKSTTLQIAAGLDAEFEGSVHYGPGVEDHLAYVFQQPRLLPWRTVQQNIELVFDDPTMYRERISDVLAAVDLSGSEDLFPGQLSLGMQRRAALARAFVLKPQLLLMDEPFVSLDAALARRLRDTLRSMLKQNPAAVVFVTHDWREAVSLADRLVFLDAGPATIRAEVKVDMADAQREDAAVQDRFRNQHASAFAGAASHASQ